MIKKIKLLIKEIILKIKFFVMNFFFYNLKDKNYKKNFFLFCKLLKIQPNNNKLIRLGNQDGDGGYLAPPIIKSSDALISIGCDKKITFEKDFLKLKKKSKVYCFEKYKSKSVKSFKNFTLINKYVKSYNDHTSISLNYFLKKIKKKNISFQIDCEGNEYSIINNLDQKFLKNTIVIVLEFHFNTLLLSSVGLQIINEVLSKLLLTHKIIHLHPNNAIPCFSICGHLIPQIIEVTFVQNKYIVSSKVKKFRNKHKLDRDNFKGNPPILLPKILWKLK